MASNNDIITLINKIFRDEILTRNCFKNTCVDVYKESWENKVKGELKEKYSKEGMSHYTTNYLQDKVQKKFGEESIIKEKKVDGSQLSFDIYNVEERTAFEICLGAIKNEFEKDVLKALLDQDTIKLVVFLREYRTGKGNTIYGIKWFDHPAQKAIIERAKIFKLDVQPVSLI